MTRTNAKKKTAHALSLHDAVIVAVCMGQRSGYATAETIESAMRSRLKIENPAAHIKCRRMIAAGTLRVKKSRSATVPNQYAATAKGRKAWLRSRDAIKP